MTGVIARRLGVRRARPTSVSAAILLGYAVSVIWRYRRERPAAKRAALA